MSECHESTCWHRYYRFVTDAAGEAVVDWDKTTIDIKDGDGYEWSDKWSGWSDEVRTRAKSRVRWALKSQKEQGRTLRKCPDGCRCPKTEPPADTDAAWTKTADSQRKKTTFSIGKDTYTIHFVVQEFTADLIQACKGDEEEIGWLPNAAELTLLDPEVLAAEIHAATG
jgi:hypothetical protein